MMEFPLQFTAPTVAKPSEDSIMVDGVTLHGHGSLDRIKIQGTPLPKDLKEDHVEVQVFYCGLNFTDNYLRLGIIRNTEFPILMGSECAGIVKRVGSSVTEVKPGQAVLCLKMHAGLFRRTVHVPQRHCFPVPSDIPMSAALALGLSSLVAHVCLFEIGEIKEHQSVFMQSIGGGVGTCLIHLAKKLPHVKILGTASTFKHKDLLNLGVHHIFSNAPNFPDRVRNVCPQGVDIVINTKGGSDLNDCLQLLKPHGKLILIGSNSTCIYPKTTTWGFVRPTWDVKEIPSSVLIGSNYTISGLNIGRLMETKPLLISRVMEDIFRRFKMGSLQPIVDTTVPFERVVEAFTYLCIGCNVGKVVLKVRHASEPDAWAEVDRPRRRGDTAAAARRHDPVLMAEGHGMAEYSL